MRYVRLPVARQGPQLHYEYGEPKLKVVVQNRKTRLFLSSAQEWTGEIEQALCFETSAVALEYAVRHSLADVQIVLKFNGNSMDIQFPINDVSSRNYVPPDQPAS